jgi:hypothetical protein
MSESKNLDITADFYGLATMRKALREVDPELGKQLNKAVKAPVQKVYNAARRNVASASVPSGWRNLTGTSPWSDPTQLGWSNDKVRSGIRLEPGRRSSDGVKPLYRIVSLSRAGNVYEFAKVAKTPRSAGFVRKLNDQRPSRLIWKAWDDSGGSDSIIPAINEAIAEVYVEFEKQLKSVPAGDRVGLSS